MMVYLLGGMFLLALVLFALGKAYNGHDFSSAVSEVVRECIIHHSKSEGRHRVN